ncbi:LuxR family transcriptional regulator [Kitasatospora sp. NPDC091335]|uniref:LuxR family transcriptional regulator n=1 Tax=Kitasatospora sp. NPDC091335 TaxID=3364085 RepID=UPI00381334AC
MRQEAAAIDAFAGAASDMRQETSAIDAFAGEAPDTAARLRHRLESIQPDVDDELIVHVYEFTLAQQSATLARISAALHVPMADVRRAVDLLCELKLLWYSPTFESFRAICPEAAQNELVIPLQQAVNEKRQELAGIHERLHTISGIFSTLKTSRQRNDKVVTLLDPQQVRIHLTDSLQHCTSEVLAMQLFDAEPRLAFQPCELARMAHRVPFRLVTPHSARAKALSRTRLRQVLDSGAQVRTTNQIFDDLVLVGDDVAYVTHQAEDGEIPSTIVVYEPMVIGLLHRMYEFAWQSGMDFDADVVSYGETLPDLSAGIMSLLAQGLKDDVVARRVGIGSRTFRRHVAGIMDSLGVSSRFQAGVVAARAGLIDGEAAGGPAQLT